MPPTVCRTHVCLSLFSCSEPPERAPSAPTVPSYARAGELPPEDMFQKERPRPPKFKTPMKPATRLMENDPAHFECRLVPVGDPDMVVEWYKDGVLLKHGQLELQNAEFFRLLFDRDIMRPILTILQSIFILLCI